MKAILGKRLYPISSAPVEDGVILEENGKIAAIGQNIVIPPDSEVFDFSDSIITPGLIDAHSHIGMFGYNGPPEGNELSNPICPQMRAEDGIDLTQAHCQHSRSGGLTSCCLLPGSGNLMGGSGVVLKLTDDNDVRKMIFGPRQFKLALGENPRRTYGLDQGRSPMTRMGNASILREALRQAKTYYDEKVSGTEPPFNERWEALLSVFEKKARVHVHCHRMDDILTAIRLLKQYEIAFSIDHVTDGHIVADILAKYQIPCIVGPISCGPQKQETWNCTPACAAVLEQTGVHQIALTVDSDDNVFMLPIDVGIAMAYGFSEAGALRSLTMAPAEILGIENRVGSLEVGKDADLAVFDGFPFLNSTSCTGVFINGIFYKSKEEY